MYKLILLSPVEYFKYRVKRNGLSLLKMTDSGYPKLVALGVCYHSTKEIVICRVGKWELRIEHERGHEAGLKHTWKFGCVMFPWEFGRGWGYK